jgi:hypothetical protein
MKQLVPEKIRNLLRPWKRPVYTILTVILKKYNNSKIIDGIFEGMIFQNKQPNTAMLLGTWEKELNPILKNLDKFDLAFDIGAAQGYYAIGIIKNHISKRVVAYEMDDSVRNTLSHLAKLNNIENSIDIKGECDLAEMSKINEFLKTTYSLWM